MESSGYGSALRAARKSLGLSVAKASALVKLSPATIKRWESGQGLPPKSELHTYLNLLGLPETSPVRQSVDGGQGPSGRREAREHRTDRPVLRLLRAKRRRKGITLTELSHATGISVASLFRYETGQRAPDEATLRTVALAVGCDETETEGLRAALYGATENGALGGPNGIAHRFLLPNNETHLQVFDLLDRILRRTGATDPGPWEAFHGLLIMGEHDTVREVWPELKPVLGQESLSYEDRVLIRITLAMVRSTFEPVETATVTKLASGVVALRPGAHQVMAMLHMARLAMAAGDLDQADAWIRSVHEYGSRFDDPGSQFLAELNQRAIEFERTGSLLAVDAVVQLRGQTEGPLQAYNVDVALSHMRSEAGDEEGAIAALELCREAEETYGFGSPLVRKIRRKEMRRL